MVNIRQVSGARDIKEFIEFPLRLYKECPQFVPPLYSDEKKLLRSPWDNESAEAVFFLATRDGRTVGRIQGIIQKEYNRLHDRRQVRFTRFDSIDDKEVAEALFSAVESFGRERGMTEICGPLAYSDLDREGLLVEGFGEDSTFEEQYNYEYYGELVESCGFSKDADWLEFELTKPDKRNEMLRRVAERSMELNRLHIADTKMSKKAYLAKYRDGFFDCIEECYRHLYGTVPISREAQDELISQFMLLLNNEYLIFICDDNERVVGLGLCFPAIGEGLKRSGGRLTPSALLKVLSLARHPETIDLGLVAIRPEYQNAGLNAVILNSLLDILEEGRVKRCETNLNLETNTPVIAQWKYFNSRQHKRRRSYIKNIEGEENA